MRTLAVDPGIRHCGVAAIDDAYGEGPARIVACALLKNPETEGAGPRECAFMARQVLSWNPGIGAGEAVLEWPQVYTHGSIDRNDLLPLAGVQAAIAAGLRMCEIVAPLPAKWKGQVKKEVMLRRIESRMHPEERALVDALKLPKSLRHNVIDACGLALWRVGRLVFERVITR